MAKVTFNSLLEVIRGSIGKLVFRKRPDGTVIISGAPRYEKDRRSQKQKEYRAHFKQGSAWAKWADDYYPIYKELSSTDVAKGAWKSPCNFALADFLKPPVIHRVERRDGCIRVEATDNVGVTRVRVTLLDEAGTVLEKGDAVRADGNWWEYACQAESHKIVTEAWDLPRPVTRFEA